MKHRALVACAVAAALSFSVVACGDDDSDSGSSSQGSGAQQEETTAKVGVILPDTASSKRWENNDRPLLKEAFDAFVTSSQRFVTGEVRLHLTPGSCEVTGRRSPHSLYDYELATYDADDSFRHEDSAGFVRLWGTQALRPVTSSLNADAPGTIGANAAIVPLDSAGRFMLESAMTSRVIVDVMAWMDDAGGR